MPKKIHVIDDDITHTEQLKSELQQNNYSVSHHSDSQTLCGQLQLERPDLVLLGTSLAGNADIIAFLKQNAVPFIFIGNAEGVDRTSSIYRLGALGLLLKPINKNQLMIEIETALHWHWEKMQLNRRRENIDETITNNRKISTAIGIVMERYKIKGHDSFEILRSAARNKQCRIFDIAEKIIASHELSLSRTETTMPSATKESPKQNDIYLGQIQHEIQMLIA